MPSALARKHTDLMLAGPIGSLDAYTQAVATIPILDQGRGAGTG